MTIDIPTLTNQLAKLLPNGAGWPKYASNLWDTLALFAPALQRAVAFSDSSVVDLFPATTATSLGDWQASCLLPDPACPPLTLTQQKNQMVTRVCDLGGQSVQYFVGHAALLGYTITVTECGVPRAGQAKAGIAASYGAYGDFTWQVHVANTTVTPFRCGSSLAGQPLSTATSIALLQYDLGRLKPAETLLEYFTY